MTSLTPEPDGRGTLAVQPSRRAWRVVLYGSVVVVLLAVVGWASTHPDELPTTGTTVRAETPVSQPVYVGVFGTRADFDRTLHVSGVRVFADATGEVRIVPHVCHGGSVGVTTTPQTFCGELGPTEGATLTGGDEIVLEVLSDVPGLVRIDRVRIAYRDGLQGPRRTPARGSRSACWPGEPRGAGQEPADRSSSAARSPASVSSSASMASVRWNHARASSERPASASASA